MSHLKIEIVTPRGLIFEEEAASCTAPGTDGEFQILPDHAALLARLDIGEIRFDLSSGKRYMATSGGILEVKKNNVSIIIETGEWAEDIEVKRAREAEDRARQRIEKEEKIDSARAEFALTRALNRLKVASHI